jgi:hypothetical protein
MTDLERARDTHAHISCYTNWNTPSISSQFSTGVRGVQKTACKTNCNFQAGTWSSPSLFSLSFYCNLHARYTHHMRLAVAQQSTMQRAIKAGRLYAVTGSHAMQSASPSRYELAESRSCGEARALTSTLRANRYLPWWSPPRHATDRQQPSQRARECAWAQTSRLRCSACRVLIRAALNSPNFLCLVCVNIKQKPLLANHDRKRAGASQVQINIPLCGACSPPGSVLWHIPRKCKLDPHKPAVFISFYLFVCNRSKLLHRWIQKVTEKSWKMK